MSADQDASLAEQLVDDFDAHVQSLGLRPVHQYERACLVAFARWMEINHVEAALQKEKS